MSRIAYVGILLKNFLFVILLCLNLRPAMAGYDSLNTGRSNRNDTLPEAGVYIRSFSMATLNEGSYRDYAGSAIGLGMHYKTRSFIGWRAGFEVLYTTELISGNVTAVDSASGSISKWELELYDPARPNDRTDLLRLNKAFIEYSNRVLLMRIGQQELESPLLNPRDGRMMPFQHGGIYVQYFPRKALHLEAAWINRVVVRGSTHWNTFNEAIGMLSEGVAQNGSPADYRFKTHSGGLAMARFQSRDFHGMRINVWDFYLDRLNNTLWIEVEKEQRDWLFGMQLVGQTPVHKPIDPLYLQGSGRSYTGSLRIQRNLSKKEQLSLNATHISSRGKFLFPRELGRESFYTSIPRSRVEGLGGSSILMMAYSRIDGMKDQVNNSIQLAAYDLPALDQYELNKYRWQNCLHLNVRSIYRPFGIDGPLQMEFLYTFRHNIGPENSDPVLIVNKSNFNQFNVIINCLI